jgi:hypothetical protein
VDRVDVNPSTVTDVRKAGSALVNRVVVAGGGGGSAPGFGGGLAGVGGGLVGGDGATAFDSTAGRGGTQNAGGGSSFTIPAARNLTHTQGNRTGNGVVVITLVSGSRGFTTSFLDHVRTPLRTR